MTNARTFAALLCVPLSLASIPAAAQTADAGLRIHEPPAGKAFWSYLNDDFTVRVRRPGGEWRDLYEYNAKVDLDRPQAPGASVRVKRIKHGDRILPITRREQAAQSGAHALALRSASSPSLAGFGLQRRSTVVGRGVIVGVGRLA